MMSPLGGGLFLVLFLALVFVVLTRVTRKSSGVQESALDILKKRYARGEITREEFERMKQELKD
ncbi:MAG: electron transporter RnfE [Deltaproteobacteria bacterium HGW-Deltaproteobacteria-8]|nr:MAG: electron transporter RnfE [Deltaproteobacteria bacterium HGW-Deltaproteobacteria-8]